MWLRRVLFISLLIFFAFLGGGIQKVRAQAADSGGGAGGDNVGPELAFFDPDSQKNVCDKVIRAHNFTGTVAVMNPVSGDPYNPCPGPNTVLRLVQITHNTTVAQMETFANKLNASGDFNSGTRVRVIVGVELNNLDEEYWGGGPSQGLAGAARTYAQLFNAFSARVDHGKYKVYPAPPDLYNAIYDPKPWIQAFAGSVDCSRIDALTGDIFNVTPQVPASDNLHAYEYYQQQLCGGSKKVDYFEGWGDGPKSSIRKQVDFYIKTPLPSGIERAATLIANTCEQDPPLDRKWFFYLQGKVFDKDGNQLDLDTCKEGGKANIYVYPGIDSQQTFNDQVKMASTYMMTCASPFAYSGKIENEDAITKPSDSTYVSYNLQCPGGPSDRSCLIPAVSGVLHINHEQTTIPLFRFDKAKVPNPGAYSRRYDDLEGFFGGIYAPLDPMGQNALNIPLGNGTTRKLSSETLRCRQTVEFLRAIKKACDGPAPNPPPLNLPSDAPLAPPHSPTPGVAPRCALDLRVQSQNLHLDNTYTEILGMYNALPAPDQDAACGQDPLGADETRLERIQKVRAALANVEHTTPKAFKPAYIVRYLNTPEKDPTIFERFQNWFAPEENKKMNIEKKKNRIIITRVYVPAGFATSPKDTSSSLGAPSTSYTSPFMGTMQAIIPKSEQDRLDKVKHDQQSEIENLTQTIGTSPDKDGTPVGETYTSHFVNCPECSGTDLESLFVKRINADISRQHMGDEYNADCLQPDLAGETAKERKTAVNPDGNSDPVREIAVSAKATLKAKATPHGPEAQLRTYFFLPEEYKNVSLYEDVFARTFLPQSLQSTLTFADKKIADANGDQTYRFLQLSDTAPKLGYNGLTVHVSSDPQNGAAVGQFVTKGIDPDTGKPITAGKTLNLKGSIDGENLDKFNINPQVPGGKLARGLWEIMCHITQPFTPGKEYAKYQGFEKFLQRGTAACFADTTTAHFETTCDIPKEEISCKNFRPLAPHSMAWTPSSSSDQTGCSTSGSPTGTGPEAVITSGVIKLALQVSNATCIPAEVLVGVMAKESRGLATDGLPITGDPQQLITRNGCTADATIQGSANIALPCGAYQYSQFDIGGQLRNYGDAIRPCLQAIGIASETDTRKVGVSMCVAAANMWRGTTFSKIRACDSHGRKLDELSPDEVRNGVLVFHGYPNDDDGAWSNYRSFIDQYKYEVAKVRGEVTSCTQ